MAITHAVESSSTAPSILAIRTRLTLPELVSREISASHASCSPFSVTFSATSSDSIDFAVCVPRSNSDTTLARTSERNAMLWPKAEKVQAKKGKIKLLRCCRGGMVEQRKLRAPRGDKRKKGIKY